ncbi:hypothetical protein GOODEAATRI_006129 [Goodea atripinnis]|uniref:Uncharacterized protein n=1 Tax=Goodea atripinnis TaxID=208336 RepID=A0ABV0PLC0_9TELE
MDSKTFYSARLHVPLALVPANPHDSDADLSDDDDPILDPDYQPIQAEYSSDTSFESLDEEEPPSTSRSSKQPPCKRHKMGKHTLKTVCLEEIEAISTSSSPSGQNQSTRRIHENLDLVPQKCECCCLTNEVY